MFLNIELAGASELQQALDDYNHRPVIEKPKPEIPQPKEIEPKEPTPEEIQPEEPEPKIEPIQQEIPEEQLVKGPSIVEPEPDPELEMESETEPELEELPQESGEALPPELKNEEALRLEKEKLEKEKAEKEKKLRKEEEEKRRLEEKRKKEKKRKEAERRRKKRLEAIKRIEKKNKAKKRRLAKIANAIKKNNEAKKKKDDSFAKMMKNEKTKWNRSSRNGSGLGNGNGLGSYGDGMGFVDSDAAIISNQIIPHWVVASGVKNAETLIIRIRIKVKDNGEVPASSIEILDKGRYNSDAVFKSAADSAKRAILKASPLKIPAEKMHLFRDFEISFNTDKALGVRR
jgi:myosin heavy subunit